MEQHAASEEKLLKLIRKKEKSSTEKDAGKKKGQESLVQQRNSGSKASANFWRLLNILLVCSLVIIAWLVVEKYMSQEETQVFENTKSEAEDAATAVQPLELPQPKSFNFYKQELERYDFFQAPWEAPAPKAAETAAVPVYDLSKDFKLVGIVLDKKPQAIIEDLESKQTYFLHVGDSIRNAVVKEIHEGKVVFSYNGQTVELVP